MAIQKTPGGTRGARVPPTSGRFAQFLARRMQAHHRRKGDRMMGMDLLYLTTVGARPVSAGRPRSHGSPTATTRG